MGFYLSPSVNVKEVDLTTIIPAVATTEAAIGGVFRWGPVEDRDLISSENELVARFGKPTNYNAETWFTSASFLAYGNKLWVSRAASTDTYNAVVTADGTTTVSSSVQIKNPIHFGTLTFADTNQLFWAKYPGAMGNSLRISVCDSANAYAKDVLLPSGATLDFTVGSNEAVLTTLATADAQAVIDELAPGYFLKVGSTSLGWQYLKIKSIGAADLVTTITFEERYFLSENVQMTGSVRRFWEFYNMVDGAPGTSPSAEKVGGVGDELHIIIVDEKGQFTGTPGTVLEVWEGLSRAEDARNANGDGIFYKEVLNASSKYVWVTHDRPGAPFATNETVTASTNDMVLDATFTGGTDGADELNIPMGQMMKAYDEFRSPEKVDVSFLILGKAVHGAYGMDLAKYLIEMAEARKDCMVTISPRKEDVVNNPYQEAESIVNVRNDLPSTSYAVMDSGYKYMYDRYNDVFRWIPINGDVAGLMVRTDEERDPWWSPAGFNRGRLKNVIKLAYNPDEADRDLLYMNGVNPVTTFPGEGTILYGDKTLLKKPSAFDRINVRRLFIVLEKSISTAAKYTLFEFNDSITRANFRAMIEPYLRDIQGRRGVYDYKVVCDETNNTPEVIDRNEFVADIYIKPARSINYITLNFVAVRTGVEFEEVVGQF